MNKTGSHLGFKDNLNSILEIFCPQPDLNWDRKTTIAPKPQHVGTPVSHFKQTLIIVKVKNDDFWVACSVTRRKSRNVYKSCPKMTALEK